MTEQNTAATPAPRRSRKGFVIGGLVGVALLAGVGAAVSHPSGEGRGWGGGHGMGMMGGVMGGGFGRMDPERMSRRIDRGVDRFLGSVNATDEQKTKVAAILKDAAKDMASLREGMGGMREEIAKLLKADTIDRATIENLRAERMARMEQASKRIAQAIGDVGETLDAKQRVQLVERMEQFGQRGRGRGWEGRGHGRGHDRDHGWGHGRRGHDHEGRGYRGGRDRD